MKIQDFPKGLTVSELRKILADWPDKKEDGSDTEVWLETGDNLSSPCVTIWPLNVRKDESGKDCADLLLAPPEAAWK